MFRGLYNSDHKAVQHKLKSRKTTEHWESKWKVLVSFSSILTVNWEGAARNRCMMWVNFWLCGWCHHEGLGFYDYGTYFDDHSLLWRGQIHLSGRGEGIFGQQADQLNETGFKVKDLRGWVPSGNTHIITSSWGTWGTGAPCAARKLLYRRNNWNVVGQLMWLKNCDGWL